MNKYETMCDTYKHKQMVNKFVNMVASKLIERGLNHDNSKLEDFEAETFAEFTPKLAQSTYGSEEYKQFLKEMKPALDHHYAHNAHHPEWENYNLVEWKDIVGYEGIYQISNFGDVKRLSHTIERNKRGNFNVEEKILKPTVTPKGYLRIQLCNRDERKNILIHRLVADHFIENPLQKPQVNHKDTNKLNNYYKNLEWCNNSENQLHAYANELQKIKYVVECTELNLVTFGCGEMERKLKKLGYEKARESSILACIYENASEHMGLHFVGYKIEEYRRSQLLNMTLIDLVEMICDWKASTLRHNDGNILVSIDKNQERFGYSSELAQIFRNTVKMFE